MLVKELIKILEELSPKEKECPVVYYCGLSWREVEGIEVIESCYTYSRGEFTGVHLEYLRPTQTGEAK
jgi:hypothetical protein